MDEATKRLLAGEVVAFPTETFYGFAVDPRSEKAVKKLLFLKDRQLEQGIPLIISNANWVENYIAEEESEVCVKRKKLQESFWPGPLTIVFRANKKAQEELSQGIFGPNQTLAVRVSSNLQATELANRVAGAITATSANRHGESPTKKANVVREMFPEVYVIENDIDSLQNYPSTLVDVTTSSFEIIREGVISKGEIYDLF